MERFADAHVHASYFESIDRMLDTIAGEGVTDVCLQSLPYRSVAYDLSALYRKMHYNRMRIRVFGGLHNTDRYTDVPAEVQAAKLLELGVDGIKLMFSPDLRKHIGYGLDDARLDRMFSLLEERDVPMTIHVADPTYFWEPGKSYGDGTFPSKQQLYDETFAMLDRHPKLRVTFAHFFFLSDCPEEAERVMQTYPNVNFDLTPGVEMYFNFPKRIEYWHDFFTRYSTRILFGTDCNSHKDSNVNLIRLVRRTLTESHELFTQPCYGRDYVIRGLALSDEVVRRICYDNYASFVGPEHPVNESLFYDCCERVLRDITAEPTDAHYRASWEVLSTCKNDPTQRMAADFCREALAAAGR